MGKPLTLGYFNRLSNNCILRDNMGQSRCSGVVHIYTHSVPIDIKTLSYSYSFSYNTCLANSIFLQTFDDGASVLTKCSIESLQSILNPDEARNNRLIINSYKRAVHDFCHEGKSADQIMLVAFEKDSNDPSGLILLKKQVPKPGN